jgi:hypothetical protein
MNREFIEGKGFWISYNPHTGCGAETALVNESKKDRFLILLGDYREDFREVVPKGYAKCLKKFKELLENGAEKSKWSN